MKKLFCTGCLLFATTLCFSATTGKTDRVATEKVNRMFFGAQGDMPDPIPGCSTVPTACPKGN